MRAEVVHKGSDLAWEDPKLVRRARQWLFWVGLGERADDKTFNVEPVTAETPTGQIGKRLVTALGFVAALPLMRVADYITERRFVGAAQSALGAEIGSRGSEVLTIEGRVIGAYWVAQKAAGRVDTNNPLSTYTASTQ